MAELAQRKVKLKKSCLPGINFRRVSLAAHVILLCSKQSAQLCDPSVGLRDVS